MSHERNDETTSEDDGENGTSCWTPIADRFASIRTSDAGKERQHVVVLGAGIAGLAAARELVALGHTVEVLEASARVGGRVMTARFDSGQYHELGAMRIPKSHDYTRHYVRELGLSLRDFVNDPEGGMSRLELRGALSKRATPQEILARFDLTPTERPAIERGGAFWPGQEVVAQWRHKLTPADRRRLFEGDLRGSSTLMELDRRSFKEALAEHRHTRTSAGWSTEALTLLGTATALEGLWDRSLAMFLRDELALNHEGLQEIVGGMDLLPRGLAALLGDRIQLEVEVERIDLQADGRVRLGLRGADGARTTRVCERVLCTLPFGVLRRMTVTGISHLKADAIRNLSYASSTKVILHCRERFWSATGSSAGVG